MNTIVMNELIREKLCVFLSLNTDNLMRGILRYAIDLGYAKYTSTLKEAWRVSIEGLSSSIIEYLETSDTMPEILPEEDFAKDPIASFGIKEAKKHRERGISLEMFLSLFKYYVITYQDALKDFKASDKEKEIARKFITKAFNKIELAYISEWTRLSGGEKHSELSEKNRELANEKNRYLTIFESMFIPVVYINNDGKLCNLNDSALQIFAPHEDSGAVYYSETEIKFPENVQKIIDDFLLNDYSDKEEVTKVKCGSKERIYEIRLQKMLDVSNKFNGIAVSFHDITDLENLLEKSDALSSLNKKLTRKVHQEFQMRMKHEQTLFQQKKLVDMGQLISAIAHQWRQPINALGLYIQDMVEEAEEGNLDEIYLKNFENKSMELIAHMSETIDDFRNFYKPDKEKIEFELIDELMKLLQLISVQISIENISLHVDCTCKNKEFKCTNSFEPAPCDYHKTKVLGYLGEFKQVLINIVHNAVFSIHKNIEKKVISEGHIGFNIFCSDNNILLKISDNGTGIPEEVIGKIFDPYFSTKDEGQGTGIGLYMSKMIVEKHMLGKLTAESSENGATFIIDLPAKHNYH